MFSFVKYRSIDNSGNNKKNNKIILNNLIEITANTYKWLECAGIELNINMFSYSQIKQRFFLFIVE